MSSWLLMSAGWLGTFAVHSTLLLLAVFVSARVIRYSERLEEVLWRFAMVAGVLTATAWRWFGFAAFEGLDFTVAPEAARVLPTVVLSEGQPRAVAADAASPGFAFFADWSALAVVLFAYALIVVLVAIVRFRNSRRWRRRLIDRDEVTDPQMLALLARLRIAAGLTQSVRLSTSDAVRSPVAFGLFAAEICVPDAVLTSMDDGQQECALAHEVAHLRGADPRWQAIFELLVRLFFFQPLLYLARRRCRDLAEYRADAWVVAHTGDRVGMAKTLLQVAEWLACAAPDGAAQASLAPAMAHRGSPLTARVRRILDATPTGAPLRAWCLVPALCGVLAGFSVGVPGVNLLRASPAAGSVQSQLIVLEREIADLYTQLAEVWLNLEGRDLPRFDATLKAFEQRLQQITRGHRALWAEALAVTDKPEPPETERVGEKK